GGPALASHPALAWNGAVHIALWQEVTVSPAARRVRATSVGADGTVLAATVNATTGTSDDTPVAAALGANVLVVFKSSRTGTANIFSARLTATLALPTPARLDASDVALSPTSSRQDRPAVAASATNWLAAWEDGRNDVQNGSSIDIFGT